MNYTGINKDFVTSNKINPHNFKIYIIFNIQLVRSILTTVKLNKQIFVMFLLAVSVIKLS